MSRCHPIGSTYILLSTEEAETNDAEAGFDLLELWKDYRNTSNLTKVIELRQLIENHGSYLPPSQVHVSPISQGLYLEGGHMHSI